MKFNQFLDLIKKKNLDTVTLIRGEERYYLRKIIERLKATYDENQVEIIHGEDTDAQTIKEKMETRDMFSSQNVLLLINPAKVKNIEKLSTTLKNKDKLTNILIIFTYQKYFKTGKKPYKFINKKSNYLFKKIYKNKLYYLVKDYIKDNNKKITKEAIDYFIERNEDNVEIIFKELDKLLIFIGEKEKIDIDDIEKLSGNFARINVFDILDSLRHQNKKKFFSTLEYILKDKDTYEVLGLLKLIYTELKKILTVKNNLNKDNNTIANKINLHPYVFKKNNYRGCSKKINYKQIKAVLKELTSADLKIKTGHDPYTVFHRLFLDFF